VVIEPLILSDMQDVDSLFRSKHPLHSLRQAFPIVPLFRRGLQGPGLGVSMWLPRHNIAEWSISREFLSARFQSNPISTARLPRTGRTSGECGNPRVCRRRLGSLSASDATFKQEIMTWVKTFHRDERVALLDIDRCIENKRMGRWSSDSDASASRLSSSHIFSPLRLVVASARARTSVSILSSEPVRTYNMEIIRISPLQDCSSTQRHGSEASRK
jgi:hypothetical protein